MAHRRLVPRLFRFILYLNLIVLHGCQISSTPEQTVSEFHQMLATGGSYEYLDDIVAEQYRAHLVDGKTRLELQTVLISRGLLKKEESKVTAVNDLTLDIHYPDDHRAQVNIKTEKYPDALTYFLIQDGARWKITYIAEPAAINPRREIVVPGNTEWKPS